MSPNPNLLALTNGAFVRRWTTGASQAGIEQLPEGYAWSIDAAFAKPVEIVYELPARAHITAFATWLSGPAVVDVATSDDDRTYRDASRIVTTAATQSSPVPIDAAGRFVRFIVRDYGSGRFTIESLAATGTLDPLPAASLAGFWEAPDDPTASSDTAVKGSRGFFPAALPAASTGAVTAIRVHDDVANIFGCTSGYDVMRATLAGGHAVAGNGALTVVAGGKMLVGIIDGRLIIDYRTAHGAACDRPARGKGPIVALFWRAANDDFPEADPTIVPGYRYESHPLPLLDAADLARARVAIIGASCNATQNLDASQQATLERWVAAGHTLIVRDADACTSSNYDFLPYPFQTSATGAAGSRGSLLRLADPSTLGSGPSDPAHAVDVDAYVASTMQQLGDGDLMITQDPHWCGLMYSRNLKGATGWIHAYARYGRGLIIYNGFDTDDLDRGVPQARKISQLEYAQPPQGDLPCNALVDSPLVLQPSSERKFAPGTRMTLAFPLSLEYPQPIVTAAATAPRDVTFAVESASHIPARLSRSHASLRAGGHVPVTLVLAVPANVRPGTYAFTVRATDRAGNKAEATIQLDADIALAKQLLASHRARIYGIHFDVNSTHIGAQSESTIAQIAGVLRAYPDWRMRVEGHTDSDGDPGANRVLSQGRARAVVADLVTHYHIAKARLSASGFGATRPVASNATSGGKALNRRVELVRL